MAIEFDDHNLFLEGSWDMEAELVSVIREMPEEEKLSLMASEDLPACILEALARDAEEKWQDLPRSA